MDAIRSCIITGGYYGSAGQHCVFTMKGETFYEHYDFPSYDPGT